MCVCAAITIERCLITPRNVVEHQMFKICSMLGVPPEDMVRRSRKARRTFFDRGTEPDKPYVLRPCPSLTSFVPRTLSEVIGVNTGGPGGARKGQAGHSKWDYLMFLQLVEACLTFDPIARVTPYEALHMGFFRTSADAI